MKKYYILSFYIALCMSSCNDFLDREPLDEITPQVYFETAEQLGTYALTQYNFNAHFGNGYDFGVFEDDNDTDIQISANGNQERWVPGILRVPDDKSYNDSEGWTFNDIYKINYFFEQVLPKYEAGVISGNESDIRHYIGEMYMIRANAYFKRLKLFGDFPIIENVIPLDDKEAQIKANERRPMNEVGRFILSDLDKAIEFMEVDASDDTRRNRLTQDAAYLLKSRVALYLGTWLKNFKGTAFVPGGTGWPGSSKSYHNNLQIDLDAEVNYFLDEAMNASKYIADKIPLVANTKTAYEESNNPYVLMFTDKDLSVYDEVIFWRAGDAASYKVGYGYAHTQGGSGCGYTRAYINSFLMADGSPIYSSSEYSGDEFLADVKTGRDNRLVQFLKIKDDVMTVLENGNQVLFPAPQILTTAEYKSATGYDLKKGLTMSVDDKTQNNQVSGVIEYRAAEAYLNYIEACYTRKGIIDSDAERYWRAIRERAGVDPDFRKTISLTDMEKESGLLSAYTAGELVDATMYNIRRERACEFMSEGKRWDDLRRWRSMDQLVSSDYQVEGFKLWGEMQNWYTGLHYSGDGSGLANVSSPSLSQYLRPYQIVTTNNNLYNGYSWTPANYLSPIEISQFLITAENTGDLSTSPLYQNPGWPTEAGASAGPVNGF